MLNIFALTVLGLAILSLAIFGLEHVGLGDLGLSDLGLSDFYPTDIGMVTIGVGSGLRGSGGALSVLSCRSAVNTGGALMVERRRRSDHEWFDRHRMMSLDPPTTCHPLSFVGDSAIALQ